MTSISSAIGDFASGLRPDHIPAEVTHQGRLLILDCIGIAFASTTFDFSKRALATATALDSGAHPIIAHSQRLTLRDAMLVNGINVHGLDFDDTHVAAVTHVSASSFPLALGLAAARGLTMDEMLAAYVLGVEVSARIGAAANSGFHTLGFHPTGLVGTFGCSVAASKLLGLPSRLIAAAQGIAGSFASANLEFLETGAWTKRIHPGWAAVSGLTAATFAQQGFEAPPYIYEGRYGLYNTHLPHGVAPDLATCTKGLGEIWELMGTAVKPYPACHFTHGCAEAALQLVREEGLTADQVKSVKALVHPGVFGVVCEPYENKVRPRSDYDAKFSLPFVVAASIVRDRFSLGELDNESLHDPTILALAAKTVCVEDLTSDHPVHYSGEVVVETTDGRTLRRRNQVNLGAASRPLSETDITEKYFANMALAADVATAERIADATVTGSLGAAVFAELLRG